MYIRTCPERKKERKIGIAFSARYGRWMDGWMDALFTAETVRERETFMGKVEKEDEEEGGFIFPVVPLGRWGWVTFG